MKWRFAIVFLYVLLAACTPRNDVASSVETRQGTSLPTEASAALANIDSLMWRQPDSALTVLMDYFASRDSLSATAFDDHYAQLLAAELLYKNDYQQTNRTDLLQAVAYFDSLVREAPPFMGARGIQRTSDPNLFFLAARAHYINGVGYYEQDSVVPACQQYLKALEIMEGHFAEKELVGKKAKFMAFTYTRLTDLFSDLYLHEQAIYFARLSLPYYQKQKGPSWYYARMLNEIGSHYDMMKGLDSAKYYYKRAITALDDTNTLMYRDIIAHQAYLKYDMSKQADTTIMELRQLLLNFESVEEKLSRYLTISAIFFHEQKFDSAWKYLTKVYNETSSIDSKKQAAEWLVEICKTQGRSPEILEYAEFLVPFANQEENQSTIKSKLNELYNMCMQKKMERQHKEETKKLVKVAITALGVLLLVMLSVVILYHVNKQKKQNLETQIEAEREAHKMQQAALAGKLKRSNEKLRSQIEEKESLLKALEAHQQQTCWQGLDIFLTEDICKEIMDLLNGKDIKREAKIGSYPELHLSTSQLSSLAIAVENNFHGFSKLLTDFYPRISNDEMRQCLLYLLNLEDIQIAHLLFCDYSTVKKRTKKLKNVFGTEKEPRQFIRELVL